MVNTMLFFVIFVVASWLLTWLTRPRPARVNAIINAAVDEVMNNRPKPRELKEARETIRRLSPALGMYLDSRFPLEPCDHTWRKAAQPKSGMYGQPDYLCGGCGEQVWEHAAGRPGNSRWSRTPPKRLNAKEMKRAAFEAGQKPLYLGSELDRPKYMVNYDPYTQLVTGYMSHGDKYMATKMSRQMYDELNQRPVDYND